MSEIATTLGELITRGRIAFFLGAGASLQESDVVTTVGETGQKSTPTRLPTARELAEQLAAYVGGHLPSGISENLIEVATYLEIYADRIFLVEALTTLLNDARYKPGGIHRLLAGLSNPVLILTTNYDRFLEQAFKNAGREFHCIVNVFRRWSNYENIKFLWFPPGNETPQLVEQGHHFDEAFPIIFKMHGSLGLSDEFSDSFVLSEEDYYEMAGREHAGKLLPWHLEARLQESHIVFLGYGLRDIHVRHALLMRQPKSQKHFAFNKNVSDFDRAYWQRFHVEAFEQDTDTFVRSIVTTLNVADLSH